MQDQPDYVVILILIVTAIFTVIWTWGLVCMIMQEIADHKKQARMYKYLYQAHPFDSRRYFEIEADSQEEADQKAHAYMSTLVEEGRTVMREFYAVKP